jgi:hypothetical protein
MIKKICLTLKIMRNYKHVNLYLDCKDFFPYPRRPQPGAGFRLTPTKTSKQKKWFARSLAAEPGHEATEVQPRGRWSPSLTMRTSSPPDAKVCRSPASVHGGGRDP